MENQSSPARPWHRAWPLPSLSRLAARCSSTYHHLEGLPPTAAGAVHPAVACWSSLWRSSFIVGDSTSADQVFQPTTHLPVAGLLAARLLELGRVRQPQDHATPHRHREGTARAFARDTLRAFVMRPGLCVGVCVLCTPRAQPRRVRRHAHVGVVRGVERERFSLRLAGGRAWMRACAPMRRRLGFCTTAIRRDNWCRRVRWPNGPYSLSSSLITQSQRE